MFFFSQNQILYEGFPRIDLLVFRRLQLEFLNVEIKRIKHQPCDITKFFPTLKIFGLLFSSVQSIVVCTFLKIFNLFVLTDNLFKKKQLFLYFHMLIKDTDN